MNVKMTLLFPAILLIASSAAVSGPPIKIRMVGHPDEVPRGVSPVPLILETRNVSGHDLKLGRTYVDLLVRDGRDEERPGCEDRLSGELAHWRVPLPPGGVLKAGNAVVQVGAFSCRRYGSTPRPLPSEVTLTLNLTASPPDHAGSFRERTWHGSVTSEPIRFRYVEPAGIDKEAYETLGGGPTGHPGTLLRDYPTSTYAAYAIYNSECAQGRIAGDPALRMKSILWTKDSGHRRNASLPDPKTGGWGSLWGRDIGMTCNEWILGVLDGHSGIWFADELRLSRAVNAIWLDEYDNAAKEFAGIAETGKPAVCREHASEYLSLMLAHGMIKPSAIPAELRAKLPPVEAAKKPAAVNK